MKAELSALPPHLQIMAVMLIVVVSGIWALVKYIKPLLGSLDKTPTSTDAVVVAASFADSKPIKELTETIENLRHSIDELILCHRHSRMEAQLHTEAVVRNTHAIKQDTK